jgi:ketosteroid isomerase-like protein
MLDRKRCTTLTVTLVLALGACSANAASSDILAQIDPALARVQREVWEVWFAGDTSRLKEITGDDLVAISPGTDGFSSLRDQLDASAGFRAGGGKLIDLRFPKMRVQKFGDVVLVYTDYEYALAMGKDTTRQSGRATEVFVKRDGKWLNPAWHMDSGK